MNEIRSQYGDLPGPMKETRTARTVTISIAGLIAIMDIDRDSTDYTVFLEVTKRRVRLRFTGPAGTWFGEWVPLA